MVIIVILRGIILSSVIQLQLTVVSSLIFKENGRLLEHKRRLAVHDLLHISTSLDVSFWRGIDVLGTFVQSHDGSIALLRCPFHCSSLNDIQRCWLRSNKEVEVGTVILIHDCRLLFRIHALILRLELIRNNLCCVQMFRGFRQVKETSFIELPTNLNCLLNNVLILFEARITSSIRGRLHAVNALMLYPLTSN